MDVHALGSAIVQHLNEHGSTPVSTRLALMDRKALSILATQLHDQLNAHRQTDCFVSGLNVRFTRTPIDPELREYYKAVRFELMLRPQREPPTPPATPRYETQRPVNVLKRALDNQHTQGTVSLGDLQAEYGRLRRGCR